ncbi:MAG: tRNA uridine-5-carboxymethylaminomethyl(34) synthesis GTPase MnmE [Christensenellaceae bacterium]|nr:tRNA uridine-5-carboxymethylaminomethyl(34) synthesis GTPase MnmE [Christensenellaceae bacterium]
MLYDTICAPSTAAGDGGIAIIRISGPDAKKALEKVFFKKTDVYEARKMYLGEVRDGGELIDTALGVYFPAPFSYTGEDVCEIQCHGGRMAAQLTISALLKNGVRPALPGEFSKRAFLNGKMDITQAEAVQEMIGALSEKGAKISATHLRGDIKNKIIGLQDQLTDVIAAIEAGVEYPEEEIEQSLAEAQLPNLKKVCEEAEKLEASYEKGKLLREGLSIAIAGRPNVGKSSLLNAILGEDRAIVTSIAGTTRDVISEYYDLRSVPVKFTDTAGIREAQDEVERIGVERSRSTVEEATLVLFVLDGSEAITEEDKEIFAAIQGKPCIIVRNKTDIEQTTEQQVEEIFGKAPISISAKSGAGVEELLDAVFDAVNMDHQLMEGVVITNSRHKFSLNKAVRALRDAYDALADGIDLDCVSIDLNDAWHALGEITGMSLTEDIIDRIFEKFCLGK